MSHNYDADVRKVDGDELLTCPECGTFMLPLHKHEISRRGSSVVGGNEPDVLLSILAVVFGTVLNFIFDLFSFRKRKKKLSRLKKHVLMSWPNSLICPQCLNLRKRS